MSGIYFYLSRKKYDFPRKRQHILPFFLLNQTKKATYIRGRLHQTKECIMHYWWSRGGYAEGATTHFGQKRPPFLGPSVGFCGAIGNFPFRTPRRGEGGAREARRAQGGGATCLQFLAFTKWPFSAKLSCRNAIQFMISSIKLILASSHRVNINLFRSNLGKRRSVFRVVVK